LASREDWAGYRLELHAGRITWFVRTGAFVVFAINTAFIGLDYVVYPQHFSGFLVARAALNAALVWIFLRLSKSAPEASEIALCLATGAMLLIVIHGSGPSTSDYFAGLILLFVGMPVLLPLRATAAAGICSVLFALYIAVPFISSESYDGVPFAVRSMFLLAAAFTSTVSCALMDRARFTDYLQRRELERTRDQLAQLDEAKSRFTANIHHELRTPLTLMLAPLDAMLGGDFGTVDAGQRVYLETMHKNALRLLKLINNLLDFAKIESGQLEVHRQPLELPRLIGEIVGSAVPLAERKGVSLVATPADGLPLVNADPDALEKVVVNLVGNALKFTDAGGRITVSAALDDGPEARALADAASDADGGDGRVVTRFVRLTVADTGLGIPPEQLQKVFDRFAQVDGSATRKHEGTGIGLSLVNELVGLHGGRVWATSEGLGHGTQFHVLLPLGEADEDAEAVVTGDDGRSLTLRRSFDALGADLDHHGDAETTPHADAEAGRYRTLEMERTVERVESERRTEAPTPAVSAEGAPLPEVVIAEDNGDMRKLLVHLLSAEFRVRAARNGREALDLVRERAPALVLTDVMMPEMSGTELCEAIKRDPALAGVPVMLVTSKAEREMKIHGLELGADDYVTKPFHPRELLARARALVRLRALQMELAEQNAALEKALDHLRQTEVALVQSERLAAVGELAAGIAHEVNNPVNFALNSLRMLKDTVGEVRDFATRVASLEWRDADKLAASARELERLEADLGLHEVAATLDELVGIVIEGLERTGRLVRDLRDFGAPGERAHGSIDLRQTIDGTLALIRPLFADRGVRVERNYEPHLPTVMGDPGGVKQVVLNLLKNAADALEETGGTVRISAAAAPDGRAAVVTVADDGPGIDSELRARIFDPFVTTKAAGRGTGLGLSICRRIAEAHHGTLEVDAAPTGGAVFTLRLPAETTNAAADRT
jgi:signal transduction histidine kinase